MGDRHRVHVGQAAAFEARLERVQPVRRDVEGVQPAGRAHGGADGQRLAAGTGAEIGHHLAAPGIEQQRQQLRAFVLHLDAPLLEGFQPRQRRLARQAQAPG